MPIEVAERLKSKDANKKETTEEVGLAFDIGKELDDAGIDVVGLAEVNERSRGVGEQWSGKKDGKGKKAQKGKTAKQVEAWRQSLINSQPKEKDMIKDIRKVLHDRLMKLEKEESTIKRKGLKAIAEYNDVIAKVRHMNRLLGEVARAGYRALKALWLRIVHGIV